MGLFPIPGTALRRPEVGHQFLEGFKGRACLHWRKIQRMHRTEVIIAVEFIKQLSLNPLVLRANAGKYDDFMILGILVHQRQLDIAGHHLAVDL